MAAASWATHNLLPHYPPSAALGRHRKKKKNDTGDHWDQAKNVSSKEVKYI